MFGVVSVPYLLVYFHRVAPAVVMDRLMDEFKGSGAVLGNLAAIYFYIYTLMQIPSGILADSWGPRRTITMGCVVSAGGSVLFGLAHSLPMAYAARFLVGLGVSVIFIPILKIIFCAPGFYILRSGPLSDTGPAGNLLRVFSPFCFLSWVFPPRPLFSPGPLGKKPIPPGLPAAPWVLQIWAVFSARPSCSRCSGLFWI